jgi:hypothetical protein
MALRLLRWLACQDGGSTRTGMRIEFTMDANELIAARLVTQQTDYGSFPQFCGVHLEVGPTRILLFASDRKTMVCFLSRSGYVAANDSEKLAAFFVPSRAIDQLKVLEKEHVEIKLLPCGKLYHLRCGDTTMTLDYGSVPVPKWKKLIFEETSQKSRAHLFPVDPLLLKNFAAMRVLLVKEDEIRAGEEEAFPELTIEMGHEEGRPCRIYLDGVPNFIGLCMPRALRIDETRTSDFIGGEQMAEIVKPPLGVRPPSRVFSFE